MVIHYLRKYFVQWFQNEFYKAPLRGTQRGLAREFPSKNEKKKKKKRKYNIHSTMKEIKLFIKVETNNN